MRLLTLPTVPSHACAARLLSSLLSSENSRLVATGDALCYTMLRPDANLAPWLLPPRSVTIEWASVLGLTLRELHRIWFHNSRKRCKNLTAVYPRHAPQVPQFGFSGHRSERARVRALVDNTPSPANGVLSEVRASPTPRRLKNTPRLIPNDQTLPQSRRSLSVEPSESTSGESHL
jgi:hypothetical protein